MTAPSHNPAPRWTRDQIRAARLAPIAPLLQRRGLQLRQRQAGNYDVEKYPGLVVKDSYWRWPERNMAGNSIDLCRKVLKLSFHDTMREIARP